MRLTFPMNWLPKRWLLSVGKSECSTLSLTKTWSLFSTRYCQEGGNGGGGGVGDKKGESERWRGVVQVELRREQRAERVQRGGHAEQATSLPDKSRAKGTGKTLDSNHARTLRGHHTEESVDANANPLKRVPPITTSNQQKGPIKDKTASPSKREGWHFFRLSCFVSIEL